METPKNFKIKAEDIVEIVTGYGGCIASDKITVEGEPVGYMYREEPCFAADSGWRFFSGTESDEFADEAGNFAIHDVNAIVNYDRTIVPYLRLMEGTELERTEGGAQLRIISGLS